MFDVQEQVRGQIELLQIPEKSLEASELSGKIKDRISEDRLFQISGSARRSLIFVCSNLSKNRRWPLWVVIPFTEWLQIAI